ncbi:MAG: hypothetical protein L6Q80_10320 [Dehalococcoidia bacterium]|nr:hypothetical protein [Dehalococcoidia bacterium]RIL02705.1 MAG: hypothetical protein DCC78_06610 [bacterium]
MASLWSRLRESLRERFFGEHWVEPSNEITRAVLAGARSTSLPAAPLYARDSRDLVFTYDQLVNPTPAGQPERAADAAPGASRPPAARRPGRAA